MTRILTYSQFSHWHANNYPDVKKNILLNSLYEKLNFFFFNSKKYKQ